jgi:hypothetical protein
VGDGQTKGIPPCDLCIINHDDKLLRLGGMVRATTAAAAAAAAASKYVVV